MKNGLVMWFVLIILLVVLIPFGVSSCNTSKANLAISQAQADAIRWEAQARATALTIAASTPVIVFGGVFIIALAVVALGIVAVVKHKATTPPPQIIEHQKIIERQIIYLPPPTKNRMNTLRALSEGYSFALLPRNTIVIDEKIKRE